MQWLPIQDVERMVRLVSQAADPLVDRTIPERRRFLVEGVAELVDADIWLWTTAVFDRSNPGDNMATSVIHGGWNSEHEFTRLFHVLTDSKMRPVSERIHETFREKYVTLGREALVQGRELTEFDAAWNGAGIGHFLLSFYPLDDTSVSSIGLYRRMDRPAFSDRERAIVHTIFYQVDWLHYHGADVPARAIVPKLSPRQRQVITLLLGGDAPKDIARKLELSEHTVGDYVKQIYRHFGVTSRGELLAHFISGGQQRN